MIVSLSPIPCLVLVLLIECIPLADPALGWRSSGAFQVRMLATNMLGSATSLYERAEYLPEFKITWQRAVIFSTGVASMNFFTSCTVMVAADIFPVPFSAFVGAIPAAVTAEVILRAFARDSGPQASGSASPGHARRLRTVQNLQLVQMLLTVVYPVYTAVFSQLSARQQLWFSLVLVLLRLGVRALQWRVSHDDEDLAGVISSASGHLFHVLFSLTCLQNAKSIDTLAVVLAFNTLQTLLNCRLLVRGSSRLPGSKRGGEDLSAVMGMIADDSFVRALDRIDPTIVLSTYHRYQDVRFRALHTPPQYTTEQAANKPKRTRRCCSRRRVHPTRPEPQGGPSTEMRARVNSKAMHRASNSFVGAGSDLEQAARALEACEMFHHCEAVLLRSYVTTIMILIHGAYITVVFWLPNRRFFLTMESMKTFEDVQDTLLQHAVLYGAELVFFTVYVALIYCRFALSGATLLAFVLSSQFTLFQAKCVSVPSFIFGFPLRHNGNDAFLTF